MTHNRKTVFLPFGCMSSKDASIIGGVTVQLRDLIILSYFINTSFTSTHDCNVIPARVLVGLPSTGDVCGGQGG